MPRFARLVLMTAALTLAWCGLALADSNEVMRLARCMEDNVDATVPAEVVQKYCNCMNRKMGSHETRTVTDWERANPQERVSCDKEAGWR